MFTLNRTSFSSDGVFGVLLGDDGSTYYTLEHAYLQPDGSYLPKIAAGIYTCERHEPERLLYVTFEVLNVPVFMGAPVTGCLIHIGNFQRDSIGCILIGESVLPDASTPMITNSKEAFQKFMDSLEGTNSFQLTIK